MLFKKEFVFEIFEHSDFYAIVISIPQFVLTPRNINVKLKQLCHMADLAFKNVEDISFVIGIYELTSYCLFTKCKVKCFADLTKDVLSNFPFLFLRKNQAQYFPTYKCIGDVICLVNDKAQDVFASPVGELMEDEGLNFEESHKRIYGTDFAEEYAGEYAKQFDMSIEKASEVLNDIQKNE